MHCLTNLFDESVQKKQSERECIVNVPPLAKSERGRKRYHSPEKGGSIGASGLESNVDGVDLNYIWELRKRVIDCRARVKALFEGL